VQAGDEVVYRRAPMLFGIGTIEQVLADGRLVVTFEDETSEQFRPDELELASAWAEAAPEAA
jgi:hypothetical protein